MVRPSTRHNRERTLVQLKIPLVTTLLDVFMIFAFLECKRFYNLLETSVLTVTAAFLVPERLAFASIFKIPLVRQAMFSALYHRRTLHLIVDLVWTLVIGIELENSLGSWRFLYHVGMMHAISQGFGAVFDFALNYLTKHSNLDKSGGSIGFSGVLLGLNFVLLASRRSRLRRRRGLSPGNVLVVSVLSLILLRALAPDASVANNIAGILAGFVYVNTPPVMGGFVAWVLLRYSEARQFILTFLEDIWDEMEEEQERGRGGQSNEGCDGRKERNQEASLTRHGSQGSMDERAKQHDQQQNEKDIDELLEWICQACSRKNGVFFILCEACRTPRQHLQTVSTFCAYRHSSSSSTHYTLPHPSLRKHLSGDRQALAASTLQLPSRKEASSAPPSTLLETSTEESHLRE